VLRAEAGGGEDGDEVLQRAAGLGFDAFGERAGGGIEAELAGNEEQSVFRNRLGVGADGGGGLVGLDDVHGIPPENGPIIDPARERNKRDCE